MLQLKTEDLSKVSDELFKIVGTVMQLQLKANQYNHTLGYIDAEYEKAPGLLGLQTEVIQALNPIRSGIREKDTAHMLEAKGLALKNFQTYGYPHVGELFRPHMTLGRLHTNDNAALEVLDSITEYTGSFVKLGLFEMGDNGTCIRKLGEWPLLS
jgi:hypothetical protein